MRSEPSYVIAGLPGDMASRIHESIKKRVIPSALTGKEIKGKEITDEFIEDYKEKTGITLCRPDKHELTLKDCIKYCGVSLYGINFATASGYEVNSLFVKHEIPFISGVTGATKEQESQLVKEVQKSKTCAIIDKNMSVPLVIFGAMLNYAAENFSGALKGYTGWGIDSHQSSKKDKISGSLVKWEDFFEQLGVEFYSAEGDRTSPLGHGDHTMEIASPDRTVTLGLSTRVLGRQTYVQGVVEKALPFLISSIEKGEQGKVYDMESVLKEKY